jgi:uncharacterized protein
MSIDPPERPSAMRRYVLALYRRVPDRPIISDDEERRLQEAHVANLRRLTEAGNIIAAGPFEEDHDLHGMILFSTESVDFAKDLLRSDPKLLNRRLALEFLTWWGPSGLGASSGPSDE